MCSKQGCVPTLDDYGKRPWQQAIVLMTIATDNCIVANDNRGIVCNHMGMVHGGHCRQLNEFDENRPILPIFGCPQKKNCT